MVWPKLLLRGNHIRNPHKFLAWCAVPGAGNFRLFNLFPVAKGNHVNAAALQQDIEPRPALFATWAKPNRKVLSDQLDNILPVGSVCSDGAGRPSPCPSDAVKTRQDAAFNIGKATTAMFVRYAFDGRRLIPDAADDHGAVHVISLVGANAAQLFVKPRALNANALNPAISLYGNGRSKKIKVDAYGFVGA